MTSPPGAADLAFALAEQALGGPVQWQQGAATLAALDGRSWLALDRAARRSSVQGRPVTGGGWQVDQRAELSSFVAAITSLHLDGRIRERAVAVLARHGTPLALAALAVRLVDHVPRVREAAWRGLRPLLDGASCAPVLDVLLAARRRQDGPAALAAVEAVLDGDPDVTERLRRAGTPRAVRRWAWARSRDTLPPAVLVAAVSEDEDQWVRASCAEGLMSRGSGEELAPLLRAQVVEARVVALVRVPDDLLDDAHLATLLVDRSPRVREQARWRARRRGLDLTAFYRRRLGDGLTAWERAACVEGLATTAPPDTALLVGHLRHDAPRVRAAAVAAVASGHSPDVAAGLLEPLLLDPSPRVGAAATRVLVRLGVAPERAEAAWSSPRPANRRSAWLLARSAGAWHRVEADLRAWADPDPHLASLGQSGLRAWLRFSAASTWAPLPTEQQVRLEDRLQAAPVPADLERLLRFHAGLLRSTR